MRGRHLRLLVLAVASVVLGLAVWPRTPRPIEVAAVTDAVAPGAPLPAADGRAGLEPSLPGAPGETLVDAAIGPAAEADRRSLARGRALDARRDPHTVRAQVVDPERRPLAGARLVVVAAGTRSEWTSEDAGRIEGSLELAPEVDPLEWTLSAPARATRRGALAPAPRTLTDLGELVLSAGGTLGGRVVDVRGEPIAGARVVIEPPVEDTGPDAARRGPSVVNAVFQRLGVDRFELSTDARGEFRVDGLDATPWAVWAHAAGREWRVESPVVLHAGDERLELVLALDDAAASRMLRGRVFAPSGEPVAGARGSASRDDVGDPRRDDFTTDADGRFVLWVDDDAPRRISCAPPSWEWDELQVAGVRAGGDELELVFVESQWIWCEVRDQTGAKLTTGRVHVLEGFANQENSRAMSDIDAQGRARLRRVRQSFRVYLEAHGFERSEQGPFDPHTQVEPLRLVAKARSGSKGRVTHLGRPVDAAAVHVLRALSDSQAEPRNWRGAGVPFDVDAIELAAARTQSARGGRFEVHLPGSHAGPFWLFVEHPSLGAAYAGPLGAADAQAERTIELQPFARVHGTLALSSGGSPSGWSVHASDAHGGERSCTVDDDGSYDLRRLWSGEWQVRAVRAGVALHDEGVRVLTGRTRRHDVALDAGSVARFDFVADDTRREFVGRLTIDGEEPGPWTAWMSSAGSMRTARIQSSGDFRCELTTEVEIELSLFGGAGTWSGWALRERVALDAARTHWSVDLATARVSGTLVTPLGDDVGLVLEVEPRDGTKLERVLLAGADGRFGPVVAPAGRATILARRLDRQSSRTPESPRVLARFELAPSADESLSIE
ncbi:MAG: carboxypeptidase-like regulatory domain-containing protein [Planctomycetes bacterium]|nr:carboxypeptidase-like regulatory domain-containing protein [Planctomycetota bacterium]